MRILGLDAINNNGGKIMLKRRRSFAITAVAAMAVLVASAMLAGCGGSDESNTSVEAAPERGGTLLVSQGEEVINLDPLEGTDFSSINVISQINEPLVRVGSKGEIEPVLASEIRSSQDQRVWTITLRNGVEFSNGQPMTSADVLFTLEQARQSAIWSGLLEGIRSVEAPSPSQIVVRTSSPFPELESLLSQWSFGIVPDNYGGVSQKEFAQHPIGTGPFVLGAWKRGESLTLDRNPKYWDAKLPYLDKVVLKAVPSPESRAAQLRGGQLNVVYQPPWSQIEAIESAPDTKVGDYPLGLVYSVALNSRFQLFQDPRVREAFDLAIDRPGIVEASLGGTGAPAGSWVSPTVMYHDTSIEPPAQDVEKAKALLSEAVEDGTKPSLTLMSLSEDAVWGTAVQIVQQNLEEVGFNVKIQLSDVSSVIEAMEGGSFDAVAEYAYSATPSPAEIIGYYNSNEADFTGADTAKTTKLAEEAAAEPDPQKREMLWHQVQQIIAEQNYVLPVLYVPYAWAQQEDVTGFEVGGTGIPWFADVAFSK